MVLSDVIPTQGDQPSLPHCSTPQSPPSLLSRDFGKEKPRPDDPVGRGIWDEANIPCSRYNAAAPRCLPYRIISYMRFIFIILFACIISPCLAQHCPWDCSGIIIFETSLDTSAVYAVDPVLVDENKRPVTDTIFGTGRENETNDLCRFLYYDDFFKQRKAKIKTHYWYAYDTVYGFAKGNYIVKYNYCKYRDKKLYLRYRDIHTRDLRYHYVEINPGLRIHLHNYDSLLHDGNTEALKKELAPFVMQVYFGIGK
jgi:hypothetical protein